jgi:hypothetical protein
LRSFHWPVLRNAGLKPDSGGWCAKGCISVDRNNQQVQFQAAPRQPPTAPSCCRHPAAPTSTWLSCSNGSPAKECAGTLTPAASGSQSCPPGHEQA